MDKLYFYHVRNDDNLIIGTVAIGQKGGTYYRGASIVNPKDQPDKKVGRAIAQGRLLTAYRRGQARWGAAANFLPVNEFSGNERPSDFVNKCGILFKSSSDTTLTAYEDQIFGVA